MCRWFEMHASCMDVHDMESNSVNGNQLEAYSRTVTVLACYGVAATAEWRCISVRSGALLYLGCSPSQSHAQSLRISRCFNYTVYYNQHVIQTDRDLFTHDNMRVDSDKFHH
jgi:hypothetical protein